MSDKNGSNKKRKDSTSITFLFAGLAATTLYFNTKANDPINTPKLIVLLLFSGWLLGNIYAFYRENPLRKNSIDFLVLPIVLFFLLAQLFSLVNSDAFIVGFIGDTQRRNGFLQYFALTVVLIYASMVFNFFHALSLLKVSLGIGLVLVAYGSLQVSDKDFVSWFNPHNSMIGTVGNPNFASSLLAIIFLLLSMTFFFKQIDMIYKISSIPVMVLALWLIYRSNSRQGLIVIAIGVLVFVSLYSIGKFKVLRYLIPCSSLILFIIGILGMLQKGPLAYFLYKDSVSVRGFYWQAAINMFKNYPVAGVGLDNYGNYFKEFRDAQYPLRFGYEITSSNAHNTFLQMFSTGGLPLGLGYCLIVAVILGVGLKNIKHSLSDQKVMSIGLLSVWVAFQSQSIISIDNIGIAIWGWILGGAILGLYRNTIRDNNLPVKHVQKKVLNLSQISVAALLMLPSLVISVLLHRQEADLFVAKAAIMQSPINQELAVLNTQRVLDNPLSDPYYQYEAAVVLNQLGKTALAESIVNDLLVKNPRHLNILNWAVENEVRKGNYSKALLRTQQIEKYDPQNVKNLLAMGELYKFLGQTFEMEKIRSKINQIAPNTETTQVANQILK